MILVEPWMTWLLVRTSPEEVRIMPVPAAWPFSKPSSVLMLTRPLSTLVATDCTQEADDDDDVEGDVAVLGAEEGALPNARPGSERSRPLGPVRRRSGPAA